MRRKYDIVSSNLDTRWKRRNIIKLFLNSISECNSELGQFYVQCPICSKKNMVLDFKNSTLICYHGILNNTSVKILGLDEITRWTVKTREVYGYEAPIDDFYDVNTK